MKRRKIGKDSKGGGEREEMVKNNVIGRERDDRARGRESRGSKGKCQSS